MNSSAKQISPVSRLRESVRARPIFSLFGQAPPDVLENRPEPAASGPEYAVNAVD
jgi:hypothetical protein